MTLDSVAETISRLIDWNKEIVSSENFYNNQYGMQLLAADCTLITAIGEGINRVNRIIPNFLSVNFPSVPWRAIVGMRNHIAHGYFELDADVVFETVKNDIPPLLDVIRDAIRLLESSDFK
ncbi:MAG: DUF86 domain-containing protein [Staphylococcus sp.]|nr:DUF86 domain-containing protein [Staphylococcus sp.]